MGCCPSQESKTKNVVAFPSIKLRQCNLPDSTAPSSTNIQNSNHQHNPDLSKNKTQVNQPQIPVDMIPSLLQVIKDNMRICIDLKHAAVINKSYDDQKIEDPIDSLKKALRQLAEKIESNIKVQKIPNVDTTEEASSKSLHSILSIVIPRFATVIRGALVSSKPILSTTEDLYNMNLLLHEAYNQPTNGLLQAYLLNITRVAVDPIGKAFSDSMKGYYVDSPTLFEWPQPREEESKDNSGDSLEVYNSSSELDYSQLESPERQKQFKSYFSDTIAFFKQKIIQSKLFLLKAKALCKYYGITNIQNFVESFSNMEVILVTHKNLWGMVGFPNRIYISTGVFLDSSLATPQKIKSKILQLLCHEGSHLALRAAMNNFLALTPCKVNPKKFDSYTETEAELLEGLEGGYRFEHLLWGKHNISVYSDIHCEKVLNEKLWNRSLPIFEEELKSNIASFRHIQNPRCSGLEMRYIRPIRQNF